MTVTFLVPKKDVERLEKEVPMTYFGNEEGILEVRERSSSDILVPKRDIEMENEAPVTFLVPKGDF